MTTPDGGMFTYAYNARGAMDHLVNPQADHTTFTYDAAGRRTRKELANTTRASYTYDAASQLTQVNDFKSDDTMITGFAYDYDAAGNRTSVLEAGGDRVTWSYDAANRLTREQRSGASAYDTTYTYDALGNRLVKEASGALTTSTYDVANQLETSEDANGVTTYTYDQAGNLNVVEQPSGQRTTTTWDDQNRQTGVVLPAGGVTTCTYRYDGLRSSKEDSEAATKYLWDFENYLADLRPAAAGTDGQNEIQAVYTNEPQQYGNLISQYRKSPTIWIPSYYQYDALGSTRALTDDGGDVTDTYAYDAWGNEVAVTGTTVNPFRWVGQVGYYWDDATRTFCIRARVYDPLTGSWMSQDPRFYPWNSPSPYARRQKSLTTAVNSLYGYVVLRPVCMLDPSGLVEYWMGLFEPGELPSGRRQCNCKRPVGGYAGSGGVCGIRFQDYGGVPHTEGICYDGSPDIIDYGLADVIGYGGVVDFEGDDRNHVIEGIRDGCCTLYLLGHRGGGENEGGIVTYPHPAPRDREMLVILPSEDEPGLEEMIGQKFKDNNCHACVINLVTCGGSNLSKGRQTRREIARRTGCYVCGSPTNTDAHIPLLDPCSLPNWKYECEPPKLRNKLDGK